MTSRKAKSKKLSTTKKSIEEQLEEVIFFVDRSSGRYSLVDGLKKLGLNVERHDDHFDENTADVEWISYCGENGWVIVSSDLAIKRNPLEKQAILSARVAAFFFTSASISSSKQIEAFSSGLRRIAALILNQKRPFIARISPDGSLELWINHKGEDVMRSKRRK